MWRWGKRFSGLHTILVRIRHLESWIAKLSTDEPPPTRETRLDRRDGRFVLWKDGNLLFCGVVVLKLRSQVSFSRSFPIRQNFTSFTSGHAKRLLTLHYDLQH